MHPSGHFFAWVINTWHMKKTLIIIITHIPLQSVPYPSKFCYGCSIIKEVSVWKKKVFCRQMRCILCKQRKSNSKAGPRPKVPCPTIYFLPNVSAILTTTPWDSILSMKRREAVRSNSSCFWNWSLFYQVKFFLFFKNSLLQIPRLAFTRSKSLSHRKVNGVLRNRMD